MSYNMLYLSHDTEPVPAHVVPLGKAPQGRKPDTLLQKLY